MEEKLIRIALEAGAHAACIIPARQLITSVAFRKACESNQCGRYGSSWICPPEVPSPEQCLQQLQAYSYALWYQSVTAIEECFDIEGMLEAGRSHSALSQTIEKLVDPLMPGGRLHLSSGGCHLCASCAKPEALPCRHPRKALRSLEAYCVDVCKTTAQTELSYVNGSNTVSYFGALLY